MLSEGRSDSASLCWPGEDLRSESPSVKLLNLRNIYNEISKLIQQAWGETNNLGTREQEKGTTWKKARKYKAVKIELSDIIDEQCKIKLKVGEFKENYIKPKVKGP